MKLKLIMGAIGFVEEEEEEERARAGDVDGRGRHSLGWVSVACGGLGGGNPAMTIGAWNS